MLAGRKEGTADRYMTDAQNKMSSSHFSNAQSSGPRVGKTAPTRKGWFSKLMGKFGKAGQFLKKMGMKAITGLLGLGPVGWGIVASIAAAGLIYYFWEDITKVWDVVVEKVTAGFTAVKEMVSGLAGSAKKMVGGFLRGVGAGMIADWIDPEGADKSQPAKEFKWGDLMGELWSVYTGIWKKVLDLAKSAGKAVGKIAAGFARKMGFGGVADWIEEKTGGDVVGNTEEQQEISDAADTKQADRRSRGKFGTKDEFMQSEEYKSQIRKPDGSLKGINTKKQDKMYKAHLDGGKVTHGSEASDPDIDDDLATTEGIHKKVGVSDANMGGVKWNKINPGGRQGVEDIVTGIWNKHGIKAKPTFTSGYRKPKDALSLANTRSKHPHGTAFDLRSKDVPSDKQSAVFADLRSSLGMKGQHEIGSVNATRRTGEHYHFQAAAQGFQGVVDKATIFLVGEGGAEMVNVTPLNSPQGRTSAMNTMQSENAQGKMGGGNAPTIVSAPQSTTVNNQSSTVLAMPPTAKNTFWDNAT